MRCFQHCKPAGQQGRQQQQLSVELLQGAIQQVELVQSQWDPAVLAWMPYAAQNKRHLLREGQQQQKEEVLVVA
jgi:hypothetical protein